MIHRKIYPRPYSMTLRENFLILRDSFALRVGSGLPEDVAELFCELTGKFTAGTVKLELAYDPLLPAFCAASGEAAAAVPESGWSYTLSLDERGAALNANDLNGLRYAFYTFLQLLQRRGEESITGYAAPFCDIKDKPALKFRGFHICIFPDIPLETVKKLFEIAAFTKYNYAVVEQFGGFKLDTVHTWNDVGCEKSEMAALARRARTMGLEIIPMCNSLGHAIMGTDVLGKNMLLEANPQLEPYLEPDGYDWCISNPAVPKLIRAMRHELYELFGPGEYVHVGCDEAFFIGSCDRCASRPLIPMLSAYLNELCAEVVSEGRRPIMWSDMLLNQKDWTGGDTIYASATDDELPTDRLLPELDRRFVIADWQYDAVTFPEPTSAYFKEQGFSTLLCSFKSEQNIVNIARSARAGGIDGVMLTLWTLVENIFPYVGPASMLIWGEDDKMPFQPTIITTDLLRKLCPSGGDYYKAGWMHSNMDRRLW